MKMMSSSRVLEITVISGEGLRPVKKNAYVTILTENNVRTTTRVDKDGGSYSVWDEKFVVDLPMHARHVTLVVQCKTFSGDKVVGEARIPTSDFVGGVLPENYLHFLSYRLRDRRGEKNGIINVSVRVKSSPEKAAAAAAGSCSSECSKPWKAAPAAGVKEPVVTGIPVWYS